MGNENLRAAKAAKNDEFYTQYADIEAEMNAYVERNPDVFRDKTILLPCDDPEWSNFTKYFANNFERFGIKKLISTSYAKGAANKQITIFELTSPLYDESKHDTHGKLFTLTRDTDGSGNIDTDDVEFSGYLEGDGDFRSEEVTKLRDEADIIITNPPFSLFREFLAWIVEANKQFIILGHMNNITYKEIFPIIKNNQIWVGSKFNISMIYKTPYPNILENNRKFVKSKGYNPDDGYVKVPGICWYTNVDLSKRHENILLDTFDHNLKYNKKLQKKFAEYGCNTYPKYDNYDAIEVPYVECIPSDYDGVMGVPISFLDKYNPDQFEIVSFRKGDDGKDLIFTRERENSTVLSYPCTTSIPGMIKNAEGKINGKPTYARITIKRIQNP